MNHLIAPSLLSADFLHLEKEIIMVNESEADWFHLDVMDGLFVPNISFGFPIIEKINKKAAKPLDVHLMIVDPDRYIQRFRDAGANCISVQYEACTHLHRTISSIKDAGAKAGVVLNPHTPVILLQDIIRDVDYILLMSVNPGFGGQKFIQQTFVKIIELKKMILETGAHALIQVDGGVDTTNAPQLIEKGADILVAGSSVFSAPDPKEAIHKLKYLLS